MKTFVIKADGKEIGRETVSDCKTVEDYANRRYGSFDYKKAKVVISIEEPKATPKAAAPVAPKAAAAPVVTAAKTSEADE